MHARRDALAAVQVHAQEDGFGEEREALETEERANDVAECAHEARPQEPQLEGEHRARDRAHREENGGAAAQHFGEIAIVAIASAQMHAFYNE